MAMQKPIDMLISKTTQTQSQREKQGLYGVSPIISIRLEKEPDSLLHMTDIAASDVKINNIDLFLADHQCLYQKYIMYVANRVRHMKVWWR